MITADLGGGLERSLLNRGMNSDKSERVTANSKKDVGDSNQDREVEKKNPEFFQVMKSQDRSRPQKTGAVRAKDDKPQGDSKGEVIERKPTEGRQKAMLKFMDSIESELGLPREKFVEAFGNLSAEELHSPPEETLDSVIESLDLEPEQELKAQALYASLLADLQKSDAASAKSLPQILSENQTTEALVGGLSVGVLAAKEHRERLNQNIDQLNSKFFMNSKGVQSYSDQANASGMSSGGLEGLSNPDSLSGEGLIPHAEGSAGLSPDVSGQKPLLKPGETFKDTAVRQESSGSSSAGASSGFASALAGAAGLGALGSQNPSEAAGKSLDGADTATLEDGGGLSVGKDSLGSAKAEELSGLQAGKESTSNSQGDSAQGDSSGSKSAKTPDQIQSEFFAPMQRDTLGEGAFGARLAAAGAAGAAGSQAALGAGADSGSQTAANLQQVMNQTQYLIKKGGGEASIRLNPEGLGEVQLKVAVQGGRVQVEMATETKEAKKILEGGMGDLKSQLQAKNFQLDTLKVDVGQQAGTDLGQQKSNDLAQQQSRQDGREQNQKFFQQFRDEGAFSQRSAFWEMPELRASQAYRRAGPTPLQPDPAASSGSSRSASRREMGRATGGGLDLVA